MSARGAVGLVGDFGVGNYGNEASLAAMLGALAERGVRDVVVVADTPERVREEHGVRAVRLEVPAGPGPVGRVVGKARQVLHLLRTARRARALVVPGTGILEGVWIEAGGLPLTLCVLGVGARLARRRYDLVAIGVDLAGSRPTRWLFGATLRLATSVSVRDERSADAAVELGLPRRPPVVPDLAFGLPPVDPSGAGVPATAGRPAFVGVGVMDYAGRDVRRSDAAQRRYEERVVALVGELLERSWAVHLVPGAEPDLAATARVAAAVAERRPGAPVTVSAARTYDEVVAELSGARAVVASRYHTVVAGLAAGVPVVPFGYGPKQDALVTSFGLPPGADIDTFVPAELAALVAEAVRRRDVLAADVGGHLARARAALAAEHDRIAGALRGDAPRKREVAA